MSPAACNGAGFWTDSGVDVAETVVNEQNSRR